MADDNTYESSGWGVNENTVIVFDVDDAGSSKAGQMLPSNIIPLNKDNKLRVKLGQDVAKNHPKSNVLSFCLGGFLSAPIAVVTNPYSVMCQTVLEAPFDSVRIGVLNADNNAVAGVKVAIGCGSTLGVNNGTLGLAATGQPITLDKNGVAQSGAVPFTTATWNGAATGTLAASPAASTGASGGNIGGSNCSITWTDWMIAPSLERADGETGLPLINVILTYPAGVNRCNMVIDSGQSGYQDWQNEGTLAGVPPYGRPFRAMVAAIRDAVGNPAWMLTSNGSAVRTFTDMPPIVIQYSLRNGFGETLVVYGDSIANGIGAAITQCGWSRKFQNTVSTPANPVSICNLAVAGSTMPMWENRVKATIGSFSQVNVFCPALTPNSLNVPITNSDITLARKSWAAVRVALDKPGVYSFTSTCLPVNKTIKAFAASDSIRVNYNTNLMTNTNYRVVDWAAAAGGTPDETGQIQLVASPDGIHPSQTLQNKMADSTAVVWKYS